MCVARPTEAEASSARPVSTHVAGLMCTEPQPVRCTRPTKVPTPPSSEGQQRGVQKLQAHEMEQGPGPTLPAPARPGSRGFRNRPMSPALWVSARARGG